MKMGRLNDNIVLLKAHLFPIINGNCFMIFPIKLEAGYGRKKINIIL